MLCLLACAAWSRPVDDAAIRRLDLEGRTRDARALLDRQLPATSPVERGWALLRRMDLDYSLDEPESALRDLKLAHRAFGRQATGLFAWKVRDTERLARSYDPRVPDLMDTLQRQSSTLALSEEERYRYLRLRFMYDATRSDARAGRRPLEVALEGLRRPDLRMQALYHLAWLALADNNWSEVERLQEEMLQTWHGTPPPVPLLDILTLQENAAEKRDRWADARASAAAILGLAQRVDGPRYEYVGWHALRTIEERQGHQREARRIWDRMLTMAGSLRSPALRADRLITMVGPKYPLEPLEKELAACWPLIPAPQVLRLKLLLAERLMVWRIPEQSRRGAELMREIIAEFRRRGDVEAEIQARVQFGRAASQGGEALEQYRQAYELRRSHPLADPGWARMSCQPDQLAIYYGAELTRQGRAVEAVEVARETSALPLAVDRRCNLLTSALNWAINANDAAAVRWCAEELDRLLPQAGPWVRAYGLQNFLQSLPAAELTPARLARYGEHYRDLLATLVREGTPTELTHAYLGQAVLLGRGGDLAGELQALEQARETARRHSLSDLLENATRALLRYHDRNERNEEVLALARQLLESPGTALHDVALETGARAYQRLKQPETALEWALRRDRLRRERHEDKVADSDLQFLARLSEAAGRPEEAFNYYERSRQSPHLTPSAKAVALSNQARLRKSAELAQRALEEALAAGDSRPVGQIASLWLRLKPAQEAGTLADPILEKLPRGGSSRQSLLANAMRRLAQAGRAEEAMRLFERYPEPAVAQELASELPELARFQAPTATPSPPPADAPPLGALLDELRMARPELGNLLTLRSTNIGALQARLAPHQLLVGYYSVGEALYLVGLTTDRTYHVRMEVTTARLRQLVVEYQGQVSNAREQVGDRSLSGLLVEPLEPWLEARTELLTVPTGDVWRVPLSALRTRDGRYLSERVVVSQLSSGDLLRLADGRYQPYRLGPALAVGAPSEADLPGALRELQQLARVLPDCTLRSGANATLTDGPWKLLHVATHASFSAREPMLSYLQLARQRLTLKQIHELKLEPDCLVALSACESGLGQEHPGSEPVSLATAFSAAGAQAVISGLWTVDDEATELLFRSFYEALRAGKAPGAALQEAQRATRARYPHPYYWAAFSLLGWPE